MPVRRNTPPVRYTVSRQRSLAQVNAACQAPGIVSKLLRAVRALPLSGVHSRSPLRYTHTFGRLVGTRST